MSTATAPKVTLYRINTRPCGDFVVQRFAGGRIQRWGTYPTREEADRDLRLANVAARDEAKGGVR